MAKNIKFSLIIPTYSGEQFIGEVFDSIISQIKGYDAEVITVIDGPQKNLEKIVKTYKQQFKEINIPFEIIKFKKNKGRFDARLAGAKKSNNSRLLFADDRNVLGEYYLDKIVDLRQDISIPNVIQEDSPTIISKTLYMIRRFIYKSWGNNFDSYYITEENFEKSSKGTTGLWVKKEIFINACEGISKSTTKSSKYINEDTKIFREFLKNGYKIYRNSDAKVYYKSRTNFKSEVVHLYDRGPRFVNYYIKPGTRFFIPLIIILILPIIVLLILLYNLILFFVLLIIFFVILNIASLLISSNLNGFVTLNIGIPLIYLIFTAGVYRGLFLILKEKL